MTTALRAARLFDGSDLVDDPAITFEAGTIIAVGDVPTGVEVLDLGDVTLLPGLVDTHQHLVFDGNGTLEEQVAGRPDDDLRDRARSNARRALAAGITTIRDLGDRGYVTLDLRDDPDLPTILASGPPITVDGGHCWYLGGGCSDTDALLDAVAERRRRGCDVVKVMVTGGANTPTYPMWQSQLTCAQLTAIVAAAHAAGMPVAAHCHGAEGIADAVDAGVDTIEHCSFFVEGGRSEPHPDVLERVIAAGIPVSATLGTLPRFTPPPVIQANLDAIIDALGTLHRRGATVVAGTDAGVSPGKPHDVLPHAARHLEMIGFRAGDVLTTLTATAALVCGVGERKGRLAAGYDADVLAVAGDPTIDTAALLDVRGVWRAGRRVV